MREYEFTLIVRGDLSDQDAAKACAKYEEILLRDGGTIINKADWGVKRLSFPIKKCFRGRYYLYDLLSLPEHVAEAERLLRIDDSVLRYMMLHIGENVDVEKRKLAIAKFAEMQRQQSQASAGRDF